jgi:hypothetical protein
MADAAGFDLDEHFVVGDGRPFDRFNRERLTGFVNDGSFHGFEINDRNEQ